MKMPKRIYLAREKEYDCDNLVVMREIPQRFSDNSISCDNSQKDKIETSWSELCDPCSEIFPEASRKKYYVYELKEICDFPLYKED